MSEESPLPASSIVPAATLLLLAGLCAYCNCFTKAFVFDDALWILNNSSLNDPWLYVQTQLLARPLVNLSLLCNYKMGGLHPFGFHLFNVTVHLLAALTLFGIVQRTLMLPRWPQRVRQAASPLALAVALLWMLHPLQTQSVTYIIQRCESLMGLFFLLTLYCAVRGWDSPRRRWWHLAAVLSCALSAESKEVAAMAPFVVVLYDWTFLDRSFAATLRRRWGLYLGLAATWGILAYQMARPSESNAGFGYKGITPLEYLLTQPNVLLYYLRLSVWPAGLCMDYQDWPRAESVIDWLPGGLVIVALLLATAYAVWRRSWLGFVGGWFFLILAPTSSIVPIADVAFEHRLYLPLASVVVLVVAGFDAVLGRLSRRAGWSSATRATIAGISLFVGGAILTGLTLTRNEDYRTAEAMYADNVAKRPDCVRARMNLAAEMQNRGALEESAVELKQVLRKMPTDPFAKGLLGFQLVQEGKIQEAIPYLRTRCEYMTPEAAAPRALLAECYQLEGDLAGAEHNFRRAVVLEPETGVYHLDLALVLRDRKKADEADREVAEALSRDPRIAATTLQSARQMVLTEFEDSPSKTRRVHAQGLLEARRACLLAPDDPAYLDTLSLAHAANNQFGQAVQIGRQALRKARSEGKTTLAFAVQRQLRFFEKKHPYLQSTARRLATGMQPDDRKGPGR